MAAAALLPAFLPVTAMTSCRHLLRYQARPPMHGGQQLHPARHASCVCTRLLARRHASSQPHFNVTSKQAATYVSGKRLCHVKCPGNITTMHAAGSQEHHANASTADMHCKDRSATRQYASQHASVSLKPQVGKR